MSVDTELDGWRQEWQVESPVLPDLEAKVRRQTRFMRIMLALEVLVTVVIGGGAIAWAILDRETDLVWLAIAVWIFIVAAWTFAFYNRRGCWAPEALNTAAFLELSIQRSRAALVSSTFGLVLYVCEMVFNLSWIYHRKLQDGPLGLETFLTSFTSIAVGMATVVFVAGMVSYRRKKRSELAYLLKLQSSVGRPPVGQ
ncbi:MAG TPA: hypothetical protein VKU19_31320 [Bryobacteraceae bacterium]|nr:hypothetical protein [Bryobacteraceae bacterium]